MAILAASCEKNAGSGGDSQPAPIALTVSVFAGEEGFVTIEGTCSPEAAARVLVTARACPSFGCNLVEVALVEVRSDATYRHRTRLSLPAAYQIEAEIGAVSSPERVGVFGPEIKDRPLSPGALLQRETDGSYKVVAQTAFRLGTEEEEAALVGEHRAALTDVLARIEYDHDQLVKAMEPGDLNDAVSAYAAWARIRSERRRKMGLTDPVLDPLFPGADREIRALWDRLDRAALWYLARHAGDEKEEERNAASARGFARDLKRLKEQTASWQTPQG